MQCETAMPLKRESQARNQDFSRRRRGGGERGRRGEGEEGRGAYLENQHQIIDVGMIGHARSKDTSVLGGMQPLENFEI